MEKINFEKTCPKCKSIFIVQRICLNSGLIKIRKKEKIYCSVGCANSHNQTSEINSKRSQKLKGLKAWNKDKTFTVEEKKEIYGNRKNSGKANVIKEYENIDFYCISCNVKLSTKTRTMKCKNCYNEDVPDFAKYKNKCRFKFNVYDYPEEFDLNLLKENKWYSASNRGNNLEGVSRDHMVSVRYGYNNNIPSEIISHPANCDLIFQKMNSKKHKKCSITIKELHRRINDWNKKYGVIGKLAKPAACKAD